VHPQELCQQLDILCQRAAAKIKQAQLATELIALMKSEQRLILTVVGKSVWLSANHIAVARTLRAPFFSKFLRRSLTC
jgi:hypothetical protein